MLFKAINNMLWTVATNKSMSLIKNSQTSEEKLRVSFSVKWSQKSLTVKYRHARSVIKALEFSRMLRLV
jgi:hypothetical protein